MLSGGLERSEGYTPRLEDQAPSDLRLVRSEAYGREHGDYAYYRIADFSQ